MTVGHFYFSISCPVISTLRYRRSSSNLFFLSFLRHYDEQLLSQAAQFLIWKHLHICTADMSHSRHVTQQTCHAADMSHSRHVTQQTCHAADMSRSRHVTQQTCHAAEMSMSRHVTQQTCHAADMSHSRHVSSRDVNEQTCHTADMSHSRHVSSRDVNEQTCHAAMVPVSHSMWCGRCKWEDRVFKDTKRPKNWQTLHDAKAPSRCQHKNSPVSKHLAYKQLL